VGRRTLFVGLTVATLLGGGVYVAGAARQATGEAALAPEPASQPIRRPAGSFVVYRSLDRVTPARYGDLAVAPLNRLAAGSTGSLRCERVYSAGGRGLCLAQSGRLRFTYRAVILDGNFRPVSSLGLSGIPSRARISPDGRYGAVTTFVSGHSYATPGTFSTQTILIDMSTGRKLANLEQFAVEHDRGVIDTPDVNFWGVTFTRNPGRFFATLATGKKTYLIQGDLRTRRAQTVRENVECPSLSPDGTRIAYKKRVAVDKSTAWMWHLYVLDLRTGHDTPLAEQRQIDDQVEWLDEKRVLYGVGEEVWVARADGKGAARRFLKAAASPSVVR
jgi:WD40 repeat protein